MESAARTGGRNRGCPLVDLRDSAYLALSILYSSMCLHILQCESDVLEQEAPCSDWGVMVDYSVRWIAEIHFS